VVLTQEHEEFVVPEEQAAYVGVVVFPVVLVVVSAEFETQQ